MRGTYLSLNQTHRDQKYTCLYDMTSNHVQFILVDLGIHYDIQDVTQDDIQNDIQNMVHVWLRSGLGPVQVQLEAQT